MAVKSRRFKTAVISGDDRASWGQPVYKVVYSQGLDCYESVVTFNNLKLGNGWSGGGPFRVDRSIHTFSPEKHSFPLVEWYGPQWGTRDVRIAYPTDGVVDLYPQVHPSTAQLLADGTTAIARTEPTNPSFDLSTFIGEIRAEGLPNIPGASAMEKTNLARKSGGEYLNVEFGWAPFVRGIRDFAKTVNNADKITRSYQEHANVATKRGYEWPDITNYQVRNCSFSEIGGNGFFTRGSRSELTVQKKWFEASYIYYLPIGNSANDKIRRYGSYARKLLGVDLSPEVLWNLSPWSWAADWFGNTGDVMHNVSALGQDGMVMRYGYIMCHTKKEVWDWGYFQDQEGLRMDHKFVEETKTRTPATPFGFGVAFDGLSGKQLAIVSALGLSRW